MDDIFDVVYVKKNVFVHQNQLIVYDIEKKINYSEQSYIFSLGLGSNDHWLIFLLMASYFEQRRYC